MNTKNTTRYKNLTDKQIIDKFYSFPLKRLISNIISFITFIIGILVPVFSSPSSETVTYMMFLFFAIGTICAAVSRMAFDEVNRRALAEEIMRRYQNNTSTNPYYYFFKREKELTGAIKQSDSSKILNVFSTIFIILNYIFTIFSALILIAFSATIPLVLGAVCCVAYVILVAARCNGAANAMLSLAKYTTIPLKLAFKFAGLALKPSFGNENHSSTVSNVTKETNHLSQMEAELKIDSYLSLSPLALPSYCSWSYGPNLSASASNVYVEGKLACNSFVHKDNNDVSHTIDKVSSDIESILNKQISDFLRDYPSAKKVSINIDIDGYID